MFSGIVSNVGSVVDTVERNDVKHVAIACDYMLSTIELYWAFALMTGFMILFVWLTKRAKGGQAAAAAE